MDPIDVVTGKRQDPPGAETTCMAMGATRAYANRINLSAMIPHSDLCSTTFCLANPGFDYLVYLPFGSHWLEPCIYTASAFLSTQIVDQIVGIVQSYGHRRAWGGFQGVDCGVVQSDYR